MVKVKLGHQPRGKFIVLEGIDGCGKTTQAKLLESKLITAGIIPVHRTFECSDGPIGSMIRHDFLSGDVKVDSTVLNDLFIVDREDHLKNPRDGGLAEIIDSGTHIICDRYVLSSMAYTLQDLSDACDRNLIPVTEYRAAVQAVYEKNVSNLHILSPDLTIFIDVDVKTAVDRINAGRDNKSIYDNEERLNKIYRAYQSVLNFFDQDIRLTGYHALQKAIPHIGPGRFTEYSAIAVSDHIINQNIVLVDGCESEEEVSENIFNLVKDLF